jgi:hypothetical protein
MSFATAATPSGLLGRQRPRIELLPSVDVTSTGEIALEVCERAGLFLDPWQRFVLTHSLGEREDGKWAAFEVAEVIPRQNGKGSTLEGRELTGLFAIDEERLIIHSAHEQATSSEHQRRLLELIESVPEFDQKVLRAPKGKGMEAIELRDGSRILFKTRTGGGGRGLTGDLIVLDEAMILPEATTAALVPTMAARSISGNPQLWYAGSAVDQEKTDHGIVLARVRDRAIKGVPRLMYVEWSAEGTDPSNVPESTLHNPQAWAQANPGLGLRISLEHIANEAAGALGPREFAVERLGIGDWPNLDQLDDGGITTAMWDRCEDPESHVLDPVCFAFDVRPDRSKATISAAGYRADGLKHVEVIEQAAGTGWVAPKLADLTGRNRPIAVVCDIGGPAASLIAHLDKLGVEVRTVTAKELAQGCGLMFDEVEQGTLRHLGTAEMKSAIKGAARRPLGDAWAWSRKSSTVDISPLVSGTLALWGLLNIDQKPARSRVLVAH